MGGSFVLASDGICIFILNCKVMAGIGNRYARSVGISVFDIEEDLLWTVLDAMCPLRGVMA